MSGWIKLHRQFKDNGHFHMPDRALKIWLYILMTVSYRDQPQWGLRAGEGWISYNMIAEDCSEDPRQRVRREAIAQALKYLEEHGYIERSISPGKGQKIRVVNWQKYQHAEEGGSGTSSASSSETEPEKAQAQTALWASGSETEHVAEPQAEPIQEVLRTTTTTTNPPIVPPLNALAGQDDRSLPGGDGGDATQAERAMLGELRKVKGYPFDYATDLKHLRDLSVDFPDVDIPEQVKRWATHKLDKPLKRGSNPRLQLRNWMSKAREFQQERGGKRHGFSSGDATSGRTTSRRAGPYRGREATTNLGSDLDVGFFGAALPKRDASGRAS